MTYTVAVAGATGYAGGEALRILAAHPDFEITCVAGHSTVGQTMAQHMPHIPQIADLTVVEATPEHLNAHDVIILALPHGASGALASELDSDAVVVDLGADHRLINQADWDTYYGGTYFPHWQYGMPELITGGKAGALTHQRSNLVGAKRIAGPGCNVTAVTLALQPALAYGLIDSSAIVADLVVGYSGAGKALKRTNLLAAEALGSATAYGVGGTHRHIPEMVQNLSFAASAYEGTQSSQAQAMRLSFTPVLAPMARGILATVSAPLSKQGMQYSQDELQQLWTKTYAQEHFIRVLDQGMLPVTGNVIGSNAAHIQVVKDERAGRLIAFAAIDNLNRGTAGQAVQSLNIALGLKEETGLTTIGVAP